MNGTHHHHPPIPCNAHDAIVGSWASCCWVDEDEDIFVYDRVGRFQLVNQPLDVRLSEALLQGVECQPAELRCNEVGAVLFIGIREREI